MDPTQIDAVVQRLVADPHDEEALAWAHESGAADPRSYALLLERVGTETRDHAYASHWLSEAANVWSSPLGDAHRAARVLMQARERVPTQRTAADRLAQLYRDKGDAKALVALLERRAKALAPLAPQSPEIRSELAAMHEELGRLWSESLQQPRKALENFRRSIDLEPSSAYAIYGAREIYKSLGQWDDAIQMYQAEISVATDPERQVALLRDEAATRRAANDMPGASRALERARQVDPHDASLQQEYAALIVERLQAGEDVPAPERSTGADLLVGLAEAYDGEHGLAYSAGALDIEPGHDRALQLYAHYARALAREDELASRYLAYVEANPNGTMAQEARWLLAGSYEAAGQIENAIQVLEPLRGLGDREATEKLRDLYGRSGQQMPSAPPPPPAPVAPASSAVRAAAPRRWRVSRERGNAAGCLDDGRPPPGRARRRPDAREQGQATGGLPEVQGGPRGRSGAPGGPLVGRGLPAYEARLLVPARRPARRRPRGRRVDRGAQGAAPRAGGALRGEPPRHRRGDQRLEAGPLDPPLGRERAAVAHPPAREDPALGRPGEPPRARGDLRGGPREAHRAREEARDAAGAEAARLHGRGRGVGPHRQPDARGRPRHQHRLEDVREGGGARPRVRGHRRQQRSGPRLAGPRGAARAARRAPREGRRPGRGRRGVRRRGRGPAEPQAVGGRRAVPRRRRALGARRPRRRPARRHGRRPQAAGVPLRARRRLLRPRRRRGRGARSPRKGRRSRPDERGALASALGPLHRGREVARAREVPRAPGRAPDRPGRAHGRAAAGGGALRVAALRQGVRSRHVAQDPR